MACFRFKRSQTPLLFLLLAFYLLLDVPGDHHRHRRVGVVDCCKVGIEMILRGSPELNGMVGRPLFNHRESPAGNGRGFLPVGPGDLI